MGSPVEMTAIASQRKTMREWSETGFESEREIEEEFCAVMEHIKSEETKPFDNKIATLPQEYTVQRLDERSELSNVIPQITKDIHSSLHCRLCATLDEDMTDIFSFNTPGNSILEMINHCLPVMVKQTDTLPKQICLFCLGELERCYRFHETVLKAEKQFLAFGKLASIKREKAERNYETVQLCDTQCGPTEYNNIDGPLMSNEELLTITEEAQPADTTVKNEVLSSILRPCSVLLSPIKFNCKTNSDPKSGRKNSSDSELWKPDPTTEASDSRATTASEIIRQSSCDSEISGLRSGKRVDPARKADIAIPEQVRTREQRYRCTVCVKVYSTRGSLNQHNKIHTNERLYGCEYCGKKYTSRTDRDRHHRIHTQDRPYSCTICQMAFGRLSSLQRHTGFHLSGKAYACSTCNKPFRSFKAREKHRMAVHIDQSPSWECGYCEQIFKAEIDMQNHRAKHKRLRTRKKLNACKYCGKDFVRKGDLCRHHRIHTGERPFECPICQKTFIEAGHMKRHALVHLEARSYSCSLCNKSFKSSKDRKRHILTHTDERPWECDVCKKKYKTKEVLRRHVVKHYIPDIGRVQL